MDNSTNLQSCLKENIENIKTHLGGSDDLIVREFEIGSEGIQREIAVLYFDGLTEEKSIHQFIMEPLMHHGNLQLNSGQSEEAHLLDRLKNSVLTVGQIHEVDNLETATDSLMNGSVVVILDGYANGFHISMAGWEQRAVSEPTNQTVIRGPIDSADHQRSESGAQKSKKRQNYENECFHDVYSGNCR